MTSKIVVNNIEPDAGISTVTVVGNVESTKFVGAVEGSVTGNVTGNLTGTASTSTNEPEKSNAVIAVPTFAVSSLTSTPDIASIVTVAIPAATAASAVTD